MYGFIPNVLAVFDESFLRRVHRFRFHMSAFLLHFGFVHVRQATAHGRFRCTCRLILIYYGPQWSDDMRCRSTVHFFRSFQQFHAMLRAAPCAGYILMPPTCSHVQRQRELSHLPSLSYAVYSLICGLVTAWTRIRGVACARLHYWRPVSCGAAAPGNDSGWRCQLWRQLAQ